MAMGEEMTTRAGLQVAATLADFVEQRALPGTGIAADTFWPGLAAIMAEFAPENRTLLTRRDALQARLDRWFDDNAGQMIDSDAYLAFLRDIGYLVPEPAPFTVAPRDVDAEVATTAGPQLVVPILNARFLLNAANARWGSLYDALYGTDAIPGTPAPGGYDATRGALVIAWAKAFLDDAVPLADGRWADWQGGAPALADPAQWVGRAGDNLLLRHHGLHIEVVIDRAHPIGRDDPAGIADVILE
jgi:malate synthase